MPLTRITFSATQLQLQENLFLVQRQYNEKVMPATTGKKINTLSDNPVSTARVLTLRNQSVTNTQYQSNLTNAKMQLSFTDQQLASAEGVLQRMRTIGLQANAGTVTSTELSQMGTQLADLKNELLAYANARFDGKYIFAGTATSTQPFSGTPTAFAGNSNATTIQATSTLTVQTNIDGNVTFSGSGGGEDIFDAIDDLRTAVMAGDATTIGTTLTRLDTGVTQIRNARATVGIRVQQIESNETALSEDRIRLLADISNLEDADIDKAISELVTRETAMRLVFATSSRVLSVISGLNLQ